MLLKLSRLLMFLIPFIKRIDKPFILNFNRL